jgi:hypothetical protein
MPDAGKSQLEKFKEAARELETDDSEAAFNERLGKIARQKPTDPPSPAKKSSKAKGRV